MHTLNTYWAFPSEISPENCKKIIDLGLSKKLIGGTTAGNNHKQVNSQLKPLGDKTYSEVKENETYIRDSEVSWISDPWLYEILWPIVKKANENAGWGYEIDFAEKCQFTVYKPGGFYGWHIDSGSDWNAVTKRHIPGITNSFKDNNYDEIKFGYSDENTKVGRVRKLSMTINLNVPGEYEGGNLKFDFGPHSTGERYHECTEIRPQGSVIVFPSYTYHQVTPITKGTRYSLVCWFIGRPFK